MLAPATLCFACTSSWESNNMATAEDLQDIDPLLSMDQVRQLVPFSACHIHRLLRAREFPPRVRLGSGARSRIAFRKSEVVRYLEDPSGYHPPEYYDDLPDSRGEAF
jgi:predicted DNA-binding transcriptional regulator AlpA